jgi:hypothetical protein
MCHYPFTPDLSIHDSSAESGVLVAPVYLQDPPAVGVPALAWSFLSSY